MKISKCIAILGLSFAAMQLHAAPKKAEAKKEVKKEAKADMKCDVTIQGTDTMQFQDADGKELKTITVSSKCPKFTVTLKHSGKLPKQVMGHNFVVTSTKDAESVYNAAVALGPDKDYLATMDGAPFKGKVIASGDKLLAGGESEDIKIDTSKLKKGGDFSFFCTFPGHFGSMQGKLIVN